VQIRARKLRCGCAMPRIHWHVQGREPQFEEGSVKLLRTFIWVNGCKRRKVAELSAKPHRGLEGEIMLRFGVDRCHIRFDTIDESDEFEQSVVKMLEKRSVLEASPPQSVEPNSPPVVSASGLELAVMAALTRAGDLPFLNPVPQTLEGVSQELAFKLLSHVCAVWESIDANRHQMLIDRHCEAQVVGELHMASGQVVVVEDDEEQQVLIRSLQEELRELEFKLAEANEAREILGSQLATQEEEAKQMKQRLVDSVERLVKLTKQLEAEKRDMKQELTLLKRRQWKASPPQAACVSPPSRQDYDVARSIAEIECVPLRACYTNERPSLRKKMLLKWHPDKQPSLGHADLAKKVMQEFQNRPEWLDS